MERTGREIIGTATSAFISSPFLLFSFITVWFIFIRILSIPINYMIGLPLGHLGDPPVREMLPSLILAGITMFFAFKRLRLARAPHAILFAVSSASVYLMLRVLVALTIGEN
jgi:hypothetical protein